MTIGEILRVMRDRKRIYIFLGVLIGSGVFAINGNYSNSELLGQVEITASFSNNEKLKLVVSNQTRSDIRFYSHQLDKYHLNIIISDKFGDVVKSYTSFSDVAPETYTVNQESQKSYNIDLSKRFVNLDAVIEEKCLILYWSMDFRLIDVDEINFYGGAVKLNCH
jgi:hypothetical protein